MHLHNPERLLQETSAADYVVAGFYIKSQEQAAAILNIANTYKRPVSLRFGTVEMMPAIARTVENSSVPVILQAVASNRSQVLTALDVGISAFVVPHQEIELIDELHGRGAFVEVSGSQLPSGPKYIKSRGVSLSLNVTRGAFTGASYVLHAGLPTQGAAFIALHVPDDCSDAHIQQLAQLPVSQLVFDTRDGDHNQAAMLALRVLPMLSLQNPAILFSH